MRKHIMFTFMALVAVLGFGFHEPMIPVAHAFDPFSNEEVCFHNGHNFGTTVTAYESCEEKHERLMSMIHRPSETPESSSTNCIITSAFLDPEL